jgi:peptide/nickel transport system ATP-binding protein
MLLITHDLGIVAQAADDVAVIYAGEILESGSKDEIFNHPAHPYTIGLFGAIPDLQTETRRLENIEGLPPNPANLPKGCCFAPRCPYAIDECGNTKYPIKQIGENHYCSCGRTGDFKIGVKDA